MSKSKSAKNGKTKATKTKAVAVPERPKSLWEIQQQEAKAKRMRIGKAFDRDALKRVCEMHETDFEETYGLVKYEIPEFDAEYERRYSYSGEVPADFYLHLDRGSDILAVAHLDTVMDHADRTATIVDTADGPLVLSGALDDRLGAYIILELLPKLGLEFDILLTVGEEAGNSTAQYFDTEKAYNWMIEFDRGGTDVVLYQYEDSETRSLVADSGARVGVGAFSDISYLEHLEIKGFNWGVGYRDYHGPRSHAWLNDTFMMVGHFLKFYDANGNEYLPHEKKRSYYTGGRRGGSTAWGWDDDEYYRRSDKDAEAEAEEAVEEAFASLDDEEVERLIEYAAQQGYNDDQLNDLRARIDAARDDEAFAFVEATSEDVDDDLLPSTIRARMAQAQDEQIQRASETAEANWMPTERADAKVIADLFGVGEGDVIHWTPADS